MCQETAGDTVSTQALLIKSEKTVYIPGFLPASNILPPLSPRYLTQCWGESTAKLPLEMLGWNLDICDVHNMEGVTFFYEEQSCTVTASKSGWTRRGAAPESFTHNSVPQLLNCYAVVGKDGRCQPTDLDLLLCSPVPSAPSTPAFPWPPLPVPGLGIF